MTHFIESVVYRRLTDEELQELRRKWMGALAYMRSKFGAAVGDMGQHWVEQASAAGEVHGFRLFQNDPDSAEDAFIQIRSYHMKDFHKADADKYVARLKLDLK